MRAINNYHYIRLSGVNALELIKEVRLTEELVKLAPKCYSKCKSPIRIKDLHSIQCQELDTRIKNN